MSDGIILYQDQILKHGRHPENFGVIDDATISINGDSPICGDHMTLYLKMNGSIIENISFYSEACCTVCSASSSMMTAQLKGNTLSYAKKANASFINMVSEKNVTELELKELGDLSVFELIHRVPSRVECAILSWNTLTAAFKQLKTSENNVDDNHFKQQSKTLSVNSTRQKTVATT